MSEKEERLDLFKEVEKQLKYPRFVHTMGVTFTATSLAICHGEDVKKAETAGLLHDVAKHLDAAEMESICAKGGVAVRPFERGKASLLHSKAGCVLAKTRYGITDPDIIHAIQYHTTGRPGMSRLEKIIFIADYIEPGRLRDPWQKESEPNLSQIQALAFGDLDAAMRKILSDTLDYLHRSGKEIDSMTQETYDFYKEAAAAEQSV